ncbi:unnamed protein product [Mycetohabitans rhizoxinica HKI 454]|uniref:Uncharacterized protein n=1 Tax=Mycetohabitans rhizoxinica (strain DSM 19002 / CIP 109453 / HKI 454) TaxID=882378 RepID=E5AP10_MYCRK|nr:unnamed protein product [Mycetohabitans rhizoxinica HKI 454]
MLTRASRLQKRMYPTTLCVAPMLAFCDETVQ